VDPFVGTWIADISRSRRHPNHLFRSATLRFELSGEAVVITHSDVDMAGQTESASTTVYPDGKVHPFSAETPDAVMVAERVSPNLLNAAAMQEGEVIGTGTYEISDGGTTLTATMRGTDAQGEPFEEVIVFDRVM
jgi:hypothetical protein